MDEFFDVVIAGTGAAGLYCALNLPERMTVLLLTKRKAEDIDSFLAQGGICMQCGESDYELYMEDTLRAGHYENDRRAVDLMIRRFICQSFYCIGKNKRCYSRMISGVFYLFYDICFVKRSLLFVCQSIFCRKFKICAIDSTYLMISEVYAIIKSRRNAG